MYIDWKNRTDLECQHSLNFVIVFGEFDYDDDIHKENDVTTMDNIDGMQINSLLNPMLNVNVYRNEDNVSC